MAYTLPTILHRLKSLLLRTTVTLLWTVLYAVETLLVGTMNRFCPQRENKDNAGIQLPTFEKAAQSLKMEFPENVFDVLLFGKYLSGNGKCVGYRPADGAPYVYLTYAELIDRATNFGAGLISLGGESNSDYLVGIFAPTSVEWTVSEYGCMAYGMVTAPLYDALGHEACFLVTEFCDIKMIICGGDAQIASLLGDSHFPKSIRIIIVITPVSEERMVQLSSLGVRIITMAEVESLGRKNPLPFTLSKPDSLATLLFTSGTTGIPKGAMVTHKQLLTSVRATANSFLPIKFEPDDTLLGLFPLAHIFERVLEKLIHIHGGKIGYISGDVLTYWFNDAKDVAPTLFQLVPRLNAHLCDTIQSELRQSPYRNLFSTIGIAFKKAEMEHRIFRKDSIWDRLVFKKYQDMLGGRIRVGITGAAATDGESLNFARAVLGCYVFEIYGQSEGAGILFSTPYGEMTTDHVGIPQQGVEAMLVDVPELEYFASEGKGELCIRAAFAMDGYYKMPEKTLEVIDPDGWMHTGDIGEWTRDGFLKIIDRKKHIFKLNQGEYLAPERLESTFARSSIIQHIFVDGNSKYPFCVALVYPNYQEIRNHMVEIKSRKAEIFIKEQIVSELMRIGQETGMQPWEIPEKIILLDEPFSQANGCLTPSQKKRRDGIRLKFREEIASMYK